MVLASDKGLRPVKLVNLQARLRPVRCVDNARENTPVVFVGKVIGDNARIVASWFDKRQSFYFCGLADVLLVGHLVLQPLIPEARCQLPVDSSYNTLIAR